jgi:hypothetical protein
MTPLCSWRHGASLLLLAVLTACGGGGTPPAPDPGAIALFAGGSSAGSNDGAGTAARFSFPIGVSIHEDGTLFVADSANGLVRRVRQDASVTTVAYQANDGAFPVSREFRDTAAAADGTLFVSYPLGSTSTRRVAVAAVAPGGALRLVDERFSHEEAPRLALHGDGRLFMTQGAALEVMHPDGSKQVLASVPPDGYGGPFIDVAVGGGGTAYVATGASIHAVDAMGRTSLIAGANTRGFADGAGNAARFERITAIAIGPSGALYVADNGMVRKIGQDGRVTTVAGVSGGSDVPVLGALPGSVGKVAGLAWWSGSLYATVGHAVLRIGPVD